jgi:hypothetical protein
MVDTTYLLLLTVSTVAGGSGRRIGARPFDHIDNYGATSDGSGLAYCGPGCAVSNDSLERTMAKRKLTKAEREERDAWIERVLANAKRTRELVERPQAKLDARRDAR